MPSVGETALGPGAQEYPGRMPFWRSWGAALLGASGAALAVPAGLLIMLAVAAGISGGGLGGLGQLTQGPELPGLSGGGPAPATPLDGGLPALPDTRTGRSTEVPPSAAADAPAASGPQTTAPGGGGGPARPGPDRPPTTSTVAPTTPATTPAPGPTSTAAPGTSASESPLRTIVRTVQGVITTVPVVGEPVSDAVGSITDILVPPAAAPRLIP
jgi:hypothetical protein